MTAAGEVLLGGCTGGGHRLEIRFTVADDKAQKPCRLGLDYIRVEELEERQQRKLADEPRAGISLELKEKPECKS